MTTQVCIRSRMWKKCLSHCYNGAPTWKIIHLLEEEAVTSQLAVLFKLQKLNANFFFLFFSALHCVFRRRKKACSHSFSFFYLFLQKSIHFNIGCGTNFHSSSFPFLYAFLNFCFGLSALTLITSLLRRCCLLSLFSHSVSAILFLFFIVC